jgi:hypothetical protein
MKKVFVCALSALVLAAGVSSCAKTTKGKITEEWNVTSIAGNSSNTSGGTTSTSSFTTTVSGNAISNVSTSGGTTNTSTGTVAEYKFNINKDGSYEMKSDITYVSGNNTQREVSSEKGTWSFVGTNKTDEFKKNERVVFNTTSSTGTTTNTTTVGGATVTSTSSSSDSYVVGENSTIYTVTESTKDKLVLGVDRNNTSSSTNGGGTTTSSAYSSKTTITLEKP